MKKTDINRILVALDPRELNRSTLRAAITLAARLDAELNALFVEDINLLRLAELPFAREVVYGSPTGRQINVADMERSLHTQTARLRKLVEGIAQQDQMNIAFEVLRGDIASEVCSASKQSDLLVIGKNTQLLPQNQRLGYITRTILTNASCNLLILQHGATIERPLVVFFDGNETSQHALSLANKLAIEDHSQLIMIYPAVDDASWQRLTKLASEHIDNNLLQLCPVRLTSSTAEETLHVIEQYQGKMLILESDSKVLPEEQQQQVIAQANIPIILLR